MGVGVKVEKVSIQDKSITTKGHLMLEDAVRKGIVPK